MKNYVLRSGLVLLALSFIALLEAGCASDRAVIAQAQQAHTSLEPAVVRDPELSRYLQEVGDRVIETANELGRQRGSGKGGEDRSWMFSEQMRFHFVNSKTLNAFTTGGEHMYIYTGLFQQCQTEDELAAVMAHEFAHVYARHVHSGINRQLGVIGAALVGSGVGYAAGGEERGSEYAAIGGGAAGIIAQFANMGFTRKDEVEADKLGFHFFTRAGWDPHRFGDFFQHMIDKGYDTTPAYLSDHPTLKSRVDDAKRRAAELPPDAEQWRRAPVADAQRFRQLQARAEQVGRTMPSDQTLANSQELLQALPRSCVAPVDPKDALEARQRVAQKVEQAQQHQAQQRPRRQNPR